MGVGDDLRTWRDDGLISFEQEQAIAERAPISASVKRPVRWAELLGYAGAISIAVAGSVLYFEQLFPAFPDEPNTNGAFLVALGMGLVLSLVGFQLSRSDEPAIRRAGGFSLALGILPVLLGLTAILLAGNATGSAPGLITWLVASLYAWLAYRVNQCAPTHLILHLAVIQAVGALVLSLEGTPVFSDVVIPSFDAPPSSGALLVWLAAAGWLAITRSGRVRPRNTGYVVSSVSLLFAAFTLVSVGDGWLVVLIATTALLGWSGTSWNSSILLAAAAIGAAVSMGVAISVLVEEPSIATVAIVFGVGGAAAFVGAFTIPNLAAAPTATGDDLGETADSG